MKNLPPAARSLRAATFVLATLGAALPASIRAQLTPTSLDPVITTATRTPAAPETIGSVVDVISAADLARRQATSLSSALGIVAGAPHFTSGANGSVSSLFLRGANSNQTLFLVDGLRLNDPNTDYQVFLGGACVGACDSLEVGHGPQSTLYGGEAMGGVISLRSQRGSGAPTAQISAEAGSFGTVQGSISSQGESGANAWSFSAAGGHTDNDRPNNEFDSFNTSLRLDRKVNDRVAIGGTVRWFHGVYGDPGSHNPNRAFDNLVNHESEENVLATAFADVKIADAWTAHAVLGGQDRRFMAHTVSDDTLVKNRRAVLDAQTTYTGVERQRLTAGITAEANHTRNTGFGDINKKQGLFAAFVQDEYTPVDNVFLTGGLRSDDFDTFGRATTGRATAAWLVVPKTLKLRATYGTAFRAPSFLDMYGKSPFYVGAHYDNPPRELRAERAHGWDAGADYYLPNKRGTLSATWFNTDFTDLIASTPSFTSVENIQKARTRGAELAAQTTLPGAIEVRAAFTYLEAINQTPGTKPDSVRLLRRPRQSGSLDAWHDFGGGFSTGAGLVFAAHRRDVNALNFKTIDAEDYTVTRLYGAWQVNPRLAVKVRLENLLNEKYEEVNGYPALGFGAFGGVEWKF